MRSKSLPSRLADSTFQVPASSFISFLAASSWAEVVLASNPTVNNPSTANLMSHLGKTVANRACRCLTESSRRRARRFSGAYNPNGRSLRLTDGEHPPHLLKGNYPCDVYYRSLCSWQRLPPPRRAAC